MSQDSRRIYFFCLNGTRITTSTNETIYERGWQHLYVAMCALKVKTAEIKEKVISISAIKVLKMHTIQTDSRTNLFIE